LARWARRLPWSEVAAIFKTTWPVVYRAVDWVVDYGLTHRSLDGVQAIGVEPDGFNINEGVGSTDTAALAAEVIASGADLGIALDGDGDRVLFVDNRGEVVDGDELLFIIACHRGSAGVVGTQMSNLGMELGLKERGIEFVRARVGDRHVNAMMQQHGWDLGGESSGHIICADHATTGDGIVAALQVLVALHSAGVDLASLKAGMVKFPQHMINVGIAGRVDLQGVPGLAEAVAETESQLGERGRVLLRPSGTEPLVRVMIEGEDAAQVGRLCRTLAARVEALLS
jgi:phosphoglucosamine mutase